MAEPKVRNKDRMMGPLLALVAAVALLGAIFYTQRDQENVQAGASGAVDAQQNAGANTNADPGQMLEIAQLNMLPLENPVPGAQNATVTLQGNVSNTGEREAREIVVEAQFYGSDGQMIHTQTEPLIPVKAENPGDAAGEGSFKDSPLRAGETRPFRISLGPIPAEWNREMPKLRLVHVVVP